MPQDFGYETFSCGRCGSSLYFPREGCMRCRRRKLDHRDEEFEARLASSEAFKSRMAEEAAERARRAADNARWAQLRGLTFTIAKRRTGGGKRRTRD